MQLSKRILLGVGVGVAVVGAGAGFAAASSSSSTTTPTQAAQMSSASAGSATINVTSASVGGRSEQILVDADGLPLYTYAGDSATTSRVSGGLAALWPPLVSASPTESGSTGTLTVLTDSNGQQVRYNGHFLYTFVDDSPGHVTGQGVQDFFVATPGLGSGTMSAAAPSASRPGGGYRY
jgi:predicted lipoprotein with Yx(FWY)xxD motif